MMSRIDSRHRKISSSHHFQNGHRNTAQIQHCSIPKVSVTELEVTLLIKYINYFTICLCYLKLTVYSNFKFSLVPSTIWINVVFMMSRIDSWHRKISTRLHFQNGHHNTTKIQHCSISKVAFDLFTDIGKIFSMSGINSGHHYLPTYQILMISDNVEFLPLIFYAVFWQPFWKW
jgi:hypothetical protein